MLRQKRNLVPVTPAFVMHAWDSGPSLDFKVFHGNGNLKASRLVYVSSLVEYFCGISGVTTGPRSRSPTSLHQDCPALPAVGWIPRYFQGKDCCVKTTCHLLVKSFWILNDESLMSPAVPSAARTNLPLGLCQGRCWENWS